MIFLMYLNSKDTIFKLQQTRTERCLSGSVCSDKLLTLKQGQGHSTWYEMVDPKQAINHLKLMELA